VFKGRATANPANIRVFASHERAIWHVNLEFRHVGLSRRQQLSAKIKVRGGTFDDRRIESPGV